MKTVKTGITILNFEVILEFFKIYFLLKFGVTLKVYDNQQSVPSKVMVCVCLCASPVSLPLHVS
jgi:hypothetical protein